MKPFSFLVVSVLSGLALASPAFAHSGPHAVHNFTLIQAIQHILTSPDHLLPFVLAIPLGALAARWAIKAKNKQDEEA